MKIKKSTPLGHSSSLPSSSSLEIRRRTQLIKLAAYSSMARAVGSRRVWSRALILKLSAGKRIGHRSSISLSARSSLRCLGMKRKRSKTVTKRFAAKKRQLEGPCPGVVELQRLVPGGESMDLCGLLEETAHFVQCLETQVRVMRSIADQLP
ncbi:hypothetical protein CDL15_Pgr013164 [Punica granatum]|nr:hypothetical protein CDL15_Pgr013164 [Punica granatum]PKI69562.1 hypothetical protein CRG98_010045 [Punica granatum]